MKSKEQKRREAIERQKEFDKLTIEQKLHSAKYASKGKQWARYAALIAVNGLPYNTIYPTGDISAYPNGKPKL